MTTLPDITPPKCGKCRKRHRPEIGCWAGPMVKELRGLVLLVYGDCCAHCGLPGSTTVEHVQPRSHGGNDSLDNLRPAHLVCNLRRGTSPMPGWGTPPITEEHNPRW